MEKKGETIKFVLENRKSIRLPLILVNIVLVPAW